MPHATPRLRYVYLYVATLITLRLPVIVALFTRFATFARRIVRYFTPFVRWLRWMPTDG